MNATVDQPDLVVEVVGFQWQWQFTYADSGIVVTGTPDGGLPVLVLPVDRTTRLDLRTTDVNHSFWVPRFLNKRDLIPGVDNAIDVTPTETGTYDGVCAEFCGLDHGRMRFAVDRHGRRRLRHLGDRARRRDRPPTDGIRERRNRPASPSSPPPTTSASASRTWSPRSPSTWSAARWRC